MARHEYRGTDGRFVPAMSDRAAEVRIVASHTAASAPQRARIVDVLKHLATGRLSLDEVAEHVRGRQWTPGDPAGDSWADVERIAGRDAGTLSRLTAARAEAPAAAPAAEQ